MNPPVRVKGHEYLGVTVDLVGDVDFTRIAHCACGWRWPSESYTLREFATEHRTHKQHVLLERVK